jgi:SAM-dependent methyltransferase
MSIARRALRPLLLRPGLRRLPPVRRAWTRAGRRAELDFWRRNPQYLNDDRREWVYVDFAGIPREWYAGKRLLDLGCGPRATLRWAADAARRVGLDPLADEYVTELGADASAMEFVAGVAEQMPFDDGAFDWVGCVNALDHFDDPEAAIAELARVLVPGGLVVLVTDVGHRARVTEPQTFGWEVLDLFRDGFSVVWEKRLSDADGGTDSTLLAGLPHTGEGAGTLAAVLERR